MLAPLVVAVVVGGGVIAVGRAASGEVFLLATVSGLAFADLARRARAERLGEQGDATDLWMTVAFAAILFAGAYDLGQRRPGGVDAFAERTLGAAMIVVGAIIRQSAARSLGENFLVRLAVRSEHTLVDSGLYRWIRHPTYAGLGLVALGTAIALWSPAALAVAGALWLPITLVRIGREERLLAARFGERYEQYRKRTWRLVPGVY